MWPAQVVAVNNATESANPIHRDDAARASGFRGGLVGGMSLYGYLSLPAIDWWGDAWLVNGSMTARFRSPVYHGDELQIRVHPGAADTAARRVDLVNSDGRICAEALIGPPTSNGPRTEVSSYRSSASGAELPLIGYPTLSSLPDLAAYDFCARVDDELVDAAARTGLASLGGVAHPKVVAAASIAIMYATFRAEGPRIHVGLATRQLGAVRYGDPLRARGRIVRAWRFKDRTYATNDVLVIDATDRAVLNVQNTTIWELPT
jgi:acyl dehydratase